MKKVKVSVTGITSTGEHGYVVVLKEEDGVKLLPIFIGVAEAHNIHLLAEGFKYVRPLTFDLFHTLLEASDTRVEDVTVTDLQDNTFYAEVTISVGGVLMKPIDARPSDAIALAIKTKAPIHVNKKVLNEAGFVSSPRVPALENIEHIEDELRDWSSKLKQAVEKEEYESAARIRDKIRELEAVKDKNLTI